MKATRVVVQMVLSIVVPLMVQLWDRRRLTAEQRERVWSGATWGAALYAFGEMSLLGWFWVTRRWRGELWAVGTSFASFFLLKWVVDQAVVRALGIKDDTGWDDVVVLYLVLLVAFKLVWLLTLLLERLGRAERDARLGAPSRGWARPARSSRSGR